MNGLTKIFILSSAFVITAFAREQKPPITPADHKLTSTPTIEAKAGYFFFASQSMRNVYSNGGFEAQVSASYPIKGVLQIYGSGGFSEVSGKSLHFHEKTTFWRIP